MKATYLDISIPTNTMCTIQMHNQTQNYHILYIHNITHYEITIFAFPNVFSIAWKLKYLKEYQRMK